MRVLQCGVALLTVLAVVEAQPHVNKWTASADAKTFTVEPGKAATCPADTDLFPDKATTILTTPFPATGSEWSGRPGFRIEYFKNYKVVTNDVANKKYLLVQRGCTAPTDVTGVTATFTIPLTSVAVGSSTYFPVFHYMGEKAAIRLYTSGTMYSDDACIQKQADDSYTKLNPAAWPANLHFDGAKYVLKTADVTSGTCTNCTCSNLAVTNSTPYHTCSSCTCADVTPTATDIEALNIEATFTGSSGWGYSHKNEILISDTTEEGFDAVAQWSEYIAAFFNRETEVSGLEAESTKRWAREQDGISNKITTKPKVLLLDAKYAGEPGGPGPWGGTWAGNYLQTCKKTGVCPATAAADGTCSAGFGLCGDKCNSHRWCDLVMDAAGHVMNMDLSAFASAKDGFQAGSKQGISDADLVAWAKDADIIILKSGSGSAADITAQMAGLKGIKAVDDKKVYDTYRMIDANGGSAAFGHAQIEPEIMLQDVIKMVDPEYNHEMVFFRNIFTEGMGNEIACVDVTDKALKDAKVGCKPTLAETVAECKDPNLTEDVLLYVPDGYSLAITQAAGAMQHGASLVSASLLALGAMSTALLL